ncbi:MAG: hypothetical protein GOVbin631_73 [Prokaryotic dsDNA virus sp.]|nr:MAG: hypothetical protein GOVbin631_73 [Prokaryotic dsDNA virus sp.]|tara:strand:- start:28931 stop:29518 length:588 start_codon:yes stop_codon:yes gene_type:complete
MGCDIHIHCEAKRHLNGEKVWLCSDHFEIDHYDGEYTVVPIYSGRDYRLFSALASVRSDGSQLNELEPKGMPSDCSKQISDDCERWGLDGHSHSYLTLFELYNYQDNNHSYKVRGMVHEDVARNLDENGVLPKMWCKSTTAQDYVFREWWVDECVMNHLIECVEKRAKETFWIYDDGRVNEDAAKDFRIVFWFDN